MLPLPPCLCFPLRFAIGRSRTPQTGRTGRAARYGAGEGGGRGYGCGELARSGLAPPAPQGVRGRGESGAEAAGRYRPPAAEVLPRLPSCPPGLRGPSYSVRCVMEIAVWSPFSWVKGSKGKQGCGDTCCEAPLRAVKHQSPSILW